MQESIKTWCAGISLCPAHFTTLVDVENSCFHFTFNLSPFVSLLCMPCPLCMSLLWGNGFESSRHATVCVTVMYALSIVHVPVVGKWIWVESPCQSSPRATQKRGWGRVELLGLLTRDRFEAGPQNRPGSPPPREWKRCECICSSRRNHSWSASWRCWGGWPPRMGR